MMKCKQKMLVPKGLKNTCFMKYFSSVLHIQASNVFPQ